MLRAPIYLRLCIIIVLFAYGESVCWGKNTSDQAQKANPQQENNKIPDFVQRRSTIPDLMLKNKKPGRNWVLFPIIGHNPDDGTILGLSVRWVTNRTKDSPLFRYAPYKSSLRLGAAYGTGEMGKFLMEYDLPYWRDTRWRLRSRLSVSRTNGENYFGVGEETLSDLRYPGSPSTFNRFKDYEDALNQNVNGRTYANYNNYRLDLKRLDLSFERASWGGCCCLSLVWKWHIMTSLTILDPRRMVPSINGRDC